ncbi:hypothetical protein ATE92_0581 [Ulvibacter sp. MAR_2010_11]|uniref:hypothetical protein n=1 Tax=Ulvibacter sp. MAR_2010_11 TaxID=1250229 RepID=UPI000CC8407B|nr:hypothetical protein [Ulvibacter sp. MAR_2010_11]PKA82452.1 hypothetical protein ATE92_0581 [Ulvibacter sp. MAR_2010_11]
MKKKLLIVLLLIANFTFSQTNEKTYVFSNQHGKGTWELVNNIIMKFPELNANLEKNEI